MIKERTCIICGIKISGHDQKKYCGECQLKRKRDYARNYMRLNKERNYYKPVAKKKTTKNIDIICTMTRYTGKFDKWKEEIRW